MLTFVSCTSNWWERVFDFPKYKHISPEVDFYSRSPAKPESWDKPKLAVLSCITHVTTLSVVIAWWEKEIKRARRLSQAPVHCCDCSSKFSHRQKKMSSPPIRAKYKHSKTIWKQTLDNSPTVFSFLKLWSSMQRVETLYNCSIFLLARWQCLSTHFFAWPSLSHDHVTVFAREFSHPSNFLLLHQKFAIRTFFWILRWYVRSACIHVECIPNTRGQKMVLVVQVRLISSISSSWDSSSAFFQKISCHPRIPTGTIFVFDERKNTPSSVLFPI